MTLAVLRQFVLRHRRPLTWAAGVAIILLVALVRTPGRTEQVNSYDSCARAGYEITQTNPPVCHGPEHHNFTGPAQTGAISTPHTAQNFTTYVDGDLASQQPRQEVVITDEAAWQTYWREIHAGSGSTPPILSVDFNQYDVVAVNDGPELTDGYRLRITAVLISPSGSIIDVTKQVPTVTCPVANKLSNRYYIITTPKLPTPVSFANDTQYRECH